MQILGVFSEITEALGLTSIAMDVRAVPPVQPPNLNRRLVVYIILLMRTWTRVSKQPLVPLLAVRIVAFAVAARRFAAQFDQRAADVEVRRFEFEGTFEVCDRARPSLDLDTDHRERV